MVSNARVMTALLLVLIVFFSGPATAQRAPCSGNRGGVAYCEGATFICADGGASASKKSCLDYGGPQSVEEKPEPEPESKPWGVGGFFSAMVEPVFRLLSFVVADKLLAVVLAMMLVVMFGAFILWLVVGFAVLRQVRGARVVRGVLLFMACGANVLACSLVFDSGGIKGALFVGAVLCLLGLAGNALSDGLLHFCDKRSDPVGKKV